MILHVLLILRIILSHSSLSAATLNAVVGKLFHINQSLIVQSGARPNIPNWLCGSPGKYQGIPLKGNIGEYRINERLSISVYQESTFNSTKSRCTQRWPTVMVIIMDNRISQLPSCERVKFWHLLNKYLPKHDSHLTFEEDIPSLLKSLSVLSQWSLKGSKRPSPSQSAIVYQIGCGSIPESVINKFKYFEKEDNINHLSKVLSLPIRGWLIADQIYPATIRKRRHRRNSYLKFTEYSSIFYQQEKQRKEDWKEAQIVVEGSGQFDENWTVPNVDLSRLPIAVSNKTKNETIPYVRKPEKSQPIIRKSLTNFTVLIGSRKYFQIPPKTFFDAEDGYNQQLKIKAFIRSKESQIDRQISFNPTQWIYFLEKQQAIGLQPRKTDVGSYYITICAYDTDRNRVCDGARLFIKKPKTINRKSYIAAPPGVVWKYPIQATWPDEVKYSNNDSIVIKVQSSSLIEWQGNISRLSLVTEAYTSKEHQIKMVAESQTTGQTLIWKMIVTSVGLNSYVDATSPELVIKLSSFHTNRIPFELINLIKEKLIGSISRYWTILKSSSREIFLYKIVKGKESFLENSKEAMSILSFVYSPLQSNPVNCSEVSFSSELVDSMKYDLRIASNNWNIELIDIIEIPGKCSNYEAFNPIPYQTTSKPNLISQDHQINAVPDLVNKSINLEVRNGLTFKKIILLPFQNGYAEVLMMELLDINNLVIDESPWVSLLISPYAIYGLPLAENVRSQPYKFKLKVTLRSGSVQEVIVNIVVVRFELQTDHRFGLIISISEKDTLEFDRARQRFNGSPLKTMNQLLVSQTLSYRWQVVETIARYLHTDQCLLDCGTHIYIHSFSEPKSWQVNISWSMLFDSPDSSDYSTTACSHEKLKKLIRLLIKSDQYTESIISMFLSSIYTFDAYPHQTLVRSLQKNSLGTPTWLTVDPLGSCSNSADKTEINSSEAVFWSNISLNQDGSVWDLGWLKLSHDGRIIYGLPLLSDLVLQSYFSLRIFLDSEEVRENLKYYLSMTLKPSRHSTASTHIVNLTILPLQNYAKNVFELDSKIKLARTINAYLHPSCSLGNRTVYNGFRMFKLEPHKRKHLQFCEKAEDVIIHSIRKRSHDKKVFVDIIWSQVSVWSTENGSDSVCNTNSLNDLSGNLFQNFSTQEINQELVSYFENSGIGQILQTQLILFDQCLKAVKRFNLDIPYSPVPKDYQIKPLTTTQASTKIVVGVLFFILIFISSICIIIYFVKRGIPATFTQLTEKTNKSMALEDFNKSPINSPVSSFIKKPKNNPTLDGFGPSLSNNSPKTPLLSQFSRDDSKSERQKEPAFNDEEAIGSYSYAARHPKSPEPEVASNNSIGISKQPATSNVIRNPAMMMGSRLNPYRNIPPPII